MQQDNVRPQKIIENHNIIPDETYQMDEPDDNISNERDQLTKIMKKQIIEDEETEQMKNLSKTIETSKRKTINHEELEKYINEERDIKNKMDEFTMLPKINRNDGDDNVNSDVVQGRSEVESEEKDKMNISKKIIMDEETEQINI